jgi:nicotinate-nucleotide pyrophosphorylase (carboxylating)
MKLLDVARLALEEDATARDVTTASLDSFLTSRSEPLPEQMGFRLVAKEPGVFSGRDWAASIAELMNLRVPDCLAEGARFEPGDVVLSGTGSAANILAAERTLLNGLQLACGVATMTADYVAHVRQVWAAKGLPGNAPGVYHTRKSPPLLRELTVNGVRAGGGCLHRVSLADRVLFKENHKYFVFRQGLRLKDYLQYLEVWGFEDFIIEVETLEEALECVEAGAKHLLLDNFTPARLQEALARLPRGIEIEVSGGLRKEALADYAQLGVTRFSVGSLTRDVRSVDLSLDIEALP